MRPVLETDGLSVSFETDGGGVTALSDVDLVLRERRITGVVGESGSGKSVLALSMLRLLPKNGRIRSGEIRFHRNRVSLDLARFPADGRQMRAIRGGEIAMIFQEPMAAFSPVHTIGNQMVETIRLHRRLSRHETRDLAVEALRKVGIGNPAQRFSQYAFELSGGMRQRAMIAMALAVKPRLLIADEPTTALDVTIQAQILTLLRNLRDETGMGVMFITHDLGVVAQLADDVVVMYLGKAVERGNVKTIFAAPAHPYTANLLAAITRPGAPNTRLQAIPGRAPGPFDRPSGCPFHTRCRRHVPGLCDVRDPMLEELDAGHSAACHLAGEQP